MNCLFIGGPWDGQVKKLRGLFPEIVVPILPKRELVASEPSFLDTPIETVRYIREQVRFGEKPYAFKVRTVYVDPKIKEESRWPEIYQSRIADHVRRLYPGVKDLLT